MPERKEQFEKIRVIVSLLIEKDGKFLLSRQTPDASRGAGCWGFPGGHIELGESLEKAVEREAREELGIKVKFEKLIGHFDYIKPLNHVLTLFCRCRIWSEKFCPGGDIDKVEWVAKEDFSKYNLRPLMKEALTTDSILGLLSS